MSEIVTMDAVQLDTGNPDLSAAQRTAAWFQDRLGHATASCFSDILGTKKAQQTYLDRLVIDRLTGKPPAEVISASLQWGKDCEPFAANLYTVETGLLVESVGFRRHRTIPFVGASADGLVGTNGGIEIKSPFNSGVHKRTWLNGMPAEHMPQVQGVMWVLELDWLDFISFDPRMPDDLRLYVQRIVRDDDYIENLKSKVTAFLSDVQADMDKLLSVPPNRLNLVIDSAAAVVPSSWELVADDAPAAVPKKRGKAVISPDNTLRNHAAIFAMFD